MKRWLIVIGVLVVGAACFAGFAATERPVPGERSSMRHYQGRVNAPEFPEGLEWLNTERPLSIRELRGKIVMLDFWTYCCINCMHIIPDLKRLEDKYAEELVVIGVHSAKFDTERETENIRQAILRYRIEHPVVNDRNMEVWRQYGARAWPTVMLIDPNGKVVGYAEGEGIFEPFDRAISQLIAEFEGEIDRRPMALKLERESMPRSVLAFPGKVLADEKSGNLFIADSNHNRIVVLSLKDHSVSEVIGGGEYGLRDGDFVTAAFKHPQGMAFDGKYLYVADTENHAIRRVDLAGKTVSTIAGTGEQARTRGLGGAATSVQLGSPWDVVLHKGALYIAMAGPHQLWRLDLKNGDIRPYAGSGREARIDGPLAQAALAQPSGITTDGEKLYFADSEVSAIRAADLDPQGGVETIVGVDLFEFGDRDGRGSQVRLQHPLGVVYHRGVLYVADTYNNKVKVVSPRDRTSKTFVGTGEEGMRDGESATFDEPAGISVAFDKLYVADTNNHAIRIVDLKSRAVETLVIRDLEKLRPSSRGPEFAGEIVEAPGQTIEPGEATLVFSLNLPEGYKLNELARTTARITAESAEVVAIAGQPSDKPGNPKFPLNVIVRAGEGSTTVKVELVIYYCEEGKESLCYFKEAQVIIPVVVKKGSGRGRIEAAFSMRIGA